MTISSGSGAKERKFNDEEKNIKTLYSAHEAIESSIDQLTTFIRRNTFNSSTKSLFKPTTKMVAIKNLFMFIVGASALTIPAVKRDAAAIQAGLNTVNSDTGKLTSAANAYNGGAINALSVQSAANTLNNDIKSTTTTANDSDVATDSEAATIIAYVNNTLKPSTSSAIDAIIAKKSQFTADSLASTVSSTLKTTLTNTNALSDALIAKSPSSQASAAQAAKSAIAAEIQRGIDAYA